MPKGNIFYSDIEIQHRKYGQGDPDRNLRIYEKMLAENEPLEPRHQLYYGRELFYHQKYQETADVLEAFLEEPDACTENNFRDTWKPFRLHGLIEFIKTLVYSVIGYVIMNA